MAAGYRAGMEPTGYRPLFVYQPKHPLVSDTVCHKLLQPFLRNAVEKAVNIRVQNPIHPPVHDRYPDGIQRIVLTPPRAKPVAEP